MTVVTPKQPRLKLDAHSYRQLRELVLKRDGWRCQRCGGASSLEVHHIRPRSRLGHDVEFNLITLCVTCHKEAHRGR